MQNADTRSATFAAGSNDPGSAANANSPWRIAGWCLLAAAAAFVLGVMVWQGVTAAGAPDPTREDVSRSAAVFDIGVLVFREGLECILVLAAIMGGMTGERSSYRRPVVAGVGMGFLVSIATWFVAVGILSKLMESIPALHIQAATGLLAVVVLVVIMNWFFHKVYWGGWMTLHNRRKKELLAGGTEARSASKLWWGLALLGFSSLYREGFEIVLFLQTYRLKLGSETVMLGLGIGLVLSVITAALTFVAHRKLPYRKMLVFTGVLLGAVLLVMVGEQAQEMQLAHWLPTTKIAWLEPYMTDWMGIWFGLFPTVESLIMQGLAATLVIGSYFAARRQETGTREPVPAAAAA